MSETIIIAIISFVLIITMVTMVGMSDIKTIHHYMPINEEGHTYMNKNDMVYVGAVLYTGNISQYRGMLFDAMVNPNEPHMYHLYQEGDTPILGYVERTDIHTAKTH